MATAPAPAVVGSLDELKARAADFFARTEWAVGVFYFWQPSANAPVMEVEVKRDLTVWAVSE